MISGHEKPLISQETDLEMRILCSGGLAFRKHRSGLRGLVDPFYFFVFFRFTPFLSSAFLNPFMRGRRTG